MTEQPSTGRIARLRETLSVCPADVTARCELAGLLEAEGRVGDALEQWRQVLAHDPNHLQAYEGVARCRRGATGTEGGGTRP